MPASECVAWWGVAQGRDPEVYEPAAAVRRDQMASFVYGMLVVAGVDVPTDASQAFDGVKEHSGGLAGRSGNVHGAAVNALAELGVVAGYDDGAATAHRRRSAGYRPPAR